MNESLKKRFKIGIFVVSAVMILSTFLPFASVLGYDFSLLFTKGSQTGDGIIVVALGVVCIVLALLNKRVPLLVAGAASFSFAIYEVLQMGQFGGLVSKEIGYWLFLLSTIVLLVLSVLNFIPSKKSERDGDGAADSSI